MGREEKRRNKLLLGSLKGFSDGVARLFGLGTFVSNHCIENPLFRPYAGMALDLREVQTYAAWKVQNDFRKLHLRQRRRLKNKVVYLQPIGPFPASCHRAIEGLNCSLFQLLQTFMAAFFHGMTVRLRETIMVDEINCKTRIHPHTDKIQLLVKDVLAFLKGDIPSDGYCIVGITWVDLYPSEEWNFVLGEAACEDGCAVLSFGHYEPQSFNKGPALTQDTNYMGSTEKPVENVSDKELSQNSQPDMKLTEQSVISCCSDQEVESGHSISSSKQRSHSSAQNSVTVSECVQLDGNRKSVPRVAVGNCHCASKADRLLQHVAGGRSLESAPTSPASPEGCNSRNQCKAQPDKGGSLSEKFAVLDKVDGKIIWRLLRGISHEASHITGMAHCAYFSCAMNESQSIQEAESQPLFMCPVCLRKLQKAIGFDVLQRYEALHAFFTTVCRDLLTLDQWQGADSDFPHMVTGFKSSLIWLQSVLAFIRNESKVNRTPEFLK